MHSAAPIHVAEPKPENQPRGCTHFKLRQLLRRVARIYDAELASAGLKGTQFSLLSQLLAHGPVQPKLLAQLLGLEASTLTRNMRIVTAAGWATQGPGADGRSRVIEITAAGRAKQAEARRYWKRAQRTLNQQFGAGRVARLHALIDEGMARLVGAAERED